MSMFMFLSIYLDAYVYAYVFAYVFAYVYVYVYVYVCVYMFHRSGIEDFKGSEVCENLWIWYNTSSVFR